jgi:hypothetical protein
VVRESIFSYIFHFDEHSSTDELSFFLSPETAQLLINKGEKSLRKIAQSSVPAHAAPGAGTKAEDLHETNTSAPSTPPVHSIRADLTIPPPAGGMTPRGANSPGSAPDTKGGTWFTNLTYTVSLAGILESGALLTGLKMAAVSFSWMAAISPLGMAALAAGLFLLPHVHQIWTQADLKDQSLLTRIQTVFNKDVILIAVLTGLVGAFIGDTGTLATALLPHLITYLTAIHMALNAHRNMKRLIGLTSFAAAKAAQAGATAVHPNDLTDGLATEVPAAAEIQTQLISPANKAFGFSA